MENIYDRKENKCILSEIILIEAKKNPYLFKKLSLRAKVKLNNLVKVVILLRTEEIYWKDMEKRLKLERKNYG